MEKRSKKSLIKLMLVLCVLANQFRVDIRALGDTNGPAIVTLSISKSNVVPGDSIHFSLEIEDETLQGSYGSLIFKSVEPNVVYVNLYYDLATNKLEGDLFIEKTIANGVWEIFSVLIYDGLGNETDATIGFWPVSFTVSESRDPDLVGPEIVNFTSSHQYAQPGDTVYFSLEISDATIESSYACLEIVAPTVSRCIDLFYNPSTSKLEGELFVEEFMVNDLWGLANVYVYDGGGNLAFFDLVETEFSIRSFSILSSNPIIEANGEVLDNRGYILKLTKGKFAETEDLLAAVRNEFGSEAEIADWLEIRTLYGSSINEFMDEIGLLLGRGENLYGAYVTYNKDRFFGNRQYFIERHDGSLPWDWLTHDTIGDFRLDLGSFYNLNFNVLAKIRINEVREYFNQDVTFTFNKGEATLNGDPFLSGSRVNDEGVYTLIVSDLQLNNTTINFTIDKTAPVIIGVSNGGSYNSSKTITFNEGMGLLDGNIFTSGSTVSTEGAHTLIVTDLAGNKTSVEFNIVTASTTLSVPETILAGEVFVVTIGIRNAVNLMGLVGTPVFDPNLLALVSISGANGYEFTYGKNLVVDNYQGKSGDFGYAVLTFRATENFKVGTSTTISFDNIVASDGLADFTVEGALVTVSMTTPVITIGDYIKTPTNQDITVTASVNGGTLNADSHSFTENGSFTFIVTDAVGNTTTETVTITNIDKTPPVITVGDYLKTPTNQEIIVTALTNEGTLNATSHTFSENGEYTFIATDLAGNETRKTVTITNIIKTKRLSTTITGIGGILKAYAGLVELSADTEFSIGSNLAFKAEPLPLYCLYKWTVNGVEAISRNLEYQLNNVNTDTVVSVEFGLKGDLNLDDTMTLTDLVKLRRNLAGLENLDQKGSFNADLNQDNELTLTDLVKLRRMMAGLE